MSVLARCSAPGRFTIVSGLALLALLALRIVPWGPSLWLIAVGGWLSVWGSRRWLGDVWVTRIVAASFAVRALLAVAFYLISAWHLPLFAGQQLGDGFWTFALDGRYYHAGAKQLANAWLYGETAPAGYGLGGQWYLSIMAAIYALTGPLPLHVSLVNALSAVGCIWLACRMARLLGDRRTARTTAWLVGFWPSSLIWSSQPLKEQIFALILLTALYLMVVTIQQVTQYPASAAAPGSSARHRRVLWVALGLAAAALGSLRQFFSLSLLLCMAVTFVPAIGFHLVRGSRRVARRLIALAVWLTAAAFIGQTCYTGVLFMKERLRQRRAHEARVHLEEQMEAAALEPSASRRGAKPQSPPPASSSLVEPFDPVTARQVVVRRSLNLKYAAGIATPEEVAQLRAIQDADQPARASAAKAAANAVVAPVPIEGVSEEDRTREHALNLKFVAGTISRRELDGLRELQERMNRAQRVQQLNELHRKYAGRSMTYHEAVTLREALQERYLKGTISPVELERLRDLSWRTAEAEQLSLEHRELVARLARETEDTERQALNQKYIDGTITTAELSRLRELQDQALQQAQLPPLVDKAYGPGTKPRVRLSQLPAMWMQGLVRWTANFRQIVRSMRAAQRFSGGHSLLFPEQDFETMGELLAYIPTKGLAAFFFAPFPWEWHDAGGTTGIFKRFAAGEALLLYLLVPAILAGSWRLLRRGGLVGRFVVIYAFASALLLSLTMTNLGTLVRYRLHPMLVFLVIVATVGVGAPYRRLGGWLLGVPRRPHKNGQGPSVLYLSYDGLLEPLGQSQILPYARGLARQGARLTLLSFEKPADLNARERVGRLREELQREDIRWTALRYHKRPAVVSTAFDVVAGLIVSARIVRRDRPRVLHARSDVPALIAWLLHRGAGIPFIFDMRGFWADERVEGGLWKRDGWLHRLAARLERRFVRDATHVVTLTERAARTVAQWRGSEEAITVIPTCVDLERFKPGAPERNGEGPVFVYTGSVGTWYALEEMLRFYETARKRFPKARLLILSRNRPEVADALRRHHLSDGAVRVESVPHEEMPHWLSRADIGLAFYKPGAARAGTCPTKIGEYLAMGLPVVVNRGVGDAEQWVEDHRVGGVVSSFTPAAYEAVLEQVRALREDPALSQRCRRVASERCSLELGVERYGSIYRRFV